MSMLKRLHRLFFNAPLPIAIKWTIAIGTLISLVMVTLGWFLITQQNRLHMREVEGFGKVLVKQLAQSASEPLLADDQFQLQGLLTRQTQNQDVIGAAILSSKGLREKSGPIPKIDYDRPFKSPYNWSWVDEDRAWHPVITFSSPIIFRDVEAGQALITIDRGFLDRHQKRVIRSITYATLGLDPDRSHPLLYAQSSAESTDYAAGPGRQVNGNRSTCSPTGTAKDGMKLARFSRISTGCPSVCSKKDRWKTPSPAMFRRSWRRRSSPISPNHVSTIKQSTAVCLFCDIVGFTELSEDLPPDEVAALLNLYLGAIAEAAHRCHGFVDKFIGDSAMILFGIPDENPDHAGQAVRCAWLIQALVQRINQLRKTKAEEPIKLRIAINSGPMLAGNIGIPDRLEYTVVGDTVNLASRLCDLAPADGIILGETTAAQSEVIEMVELYQQPPIKVRGRKTLVTPAIMGNPNRAIRVWLYESMHRILDRAEG